MVLTLLFITLLVGVILMALLKVSTVGSLLVYPPTRSLPALLSMVVLKQQLSLLQLLNTTLPWLVLLLEILLMPLGKMLTAPAITNQLLVSGDTLTCDLKVS